MNPHPTITAFIKHFRPCSEGTSFALACSSPEEVWLKAKPTDLIWIATRKGVLTDKELRLFTVWSARQVQHLMKDPHSLAALDVAERFANGQATIEELKEAGQQAYTAYAAAYAAAYATATAATAAAAADAAAYATAADAAAYATAAYAYATAAYAADAAAADAYATATAADAAAAYATADAAAARKNQAQWLRANTQPNFERALLP